MSVNLNPDSYIPSGIPLKWEYQSEDRVLLLKYALYNPETEQYHDIRIERPRGWLWGYQGEAFKKDITEEDLQTIRKTYDTVLRGIGAKPGDEGKISSNLDRTDFYMEENGKSASKKVSSTDLGIAYGDNEHLIQQEGRTITVHAMMLEGILNPLGIRKGDVEFSSSLNTVGTIASQANKPANRLMISPNPKLIQHPLNKWPLLVKPFVTPSVSKIADYQRLELREQQKQLMEYVDRSCNVPLSAFAANNEPCQIEKKLFERWKASLHRVMQAPHKKDRVGLTRQEEEDDAKMVQLVQAWNEAAYRFLRANGEPENGEMARLFRSYSNPSEAIDVYWKKEAPVYWLALLPQEYGQLSKLEDFLKNR